jgi:hypothetical protein
MPNEIGELTGVLGGLWGFYMPNETGGNFPSVQLLNNVGQPLSPILTGISSNYWQLDPTDSIRIGDWEYLANGNIVIVGDSRHNADLVNLYGGTNAGNHTIYRIVTQAGAVVKPEALVNDTPVPSSIWHGAGVTSNGFAVRFNDNFRGVVVRMFNNNGNPTTPDLVLTTLVDPRAGGGSRGDGAGFHGNGIDAYAHAASYSLNGTNGVWVTVLNADGTVRWSRDVYDDLTPVTVDRGDCAINEKGEVVVVFGAQCDVSLPLGLVGRRFSAAGIPVGGSFYISEVEVPDPSNPNIALATYSRVAWRNNQVAVAWRSQNDPGNPFINEVATRIFAANPSLSASLSASRAGNTVTISWPTNFIGFTLQSSTNVAPASWQSVTTTNNSLTLTNPVGHMFFRLAE